MEIKNISHKTKCDINGCKDFAEISIFDTTSNKSILNLCKKCSDGIYKCLAENSVPKSVPAPFKNQTKVRRKNETR